MAASTGPTGPAGITGVTGPTGPGMGCAMPSYTFVANEDTITIIDPLTHATSVVQAPFPVSNLAVDPELRKLYIISADGQFAVWDEPTRTFTELDTLPGATAIAVNRNNHKVFVTSREGNLITIFNGYTGLRLSQISIDSPGDIVINPETNIAYVSTRSGLMLINTNSGSVIGSVDYTGNLTGMTVNYCANKIFAIDDSAGIAVIDAKCNVICAHFDIPEGVHSIVVNPRLSLLYIVTADGSSVLVYDACTYERVGQLELPYSAQINGISIDLPNHLLYLTDAAGASFVFVLDGGTNEQTGAMPGVVNTGGVVTMACNPPCNNNPCCGREPVLPPEPPSPYIEQFFLHASTTHAPQGSTVELYISLNPYYGAYGGTGSYFMGDYTDFDEIENLSSLAQQGLLSALPQYDQIEYAPEAPSYEEFEFTPQVALCNFIWSIDHQTDPSTHLGSTEEGLLHNTLHIGDNELGVVIVRVTCPLNDRIAQSAIFIRFPTPELFTNNCMLPRGGSTVIYRMDENENPVFATYSIMGAPIPGTEIHPIDSSIGVFGIHVAENDLRPWLPLVMHTDGRTFHYALAIGEFYVQADLTSVSPGDTVQLAANNTMASAIWEIVSPHAAGTLLQSSRGDQGILYIAPNETNSFITVRASLIMDENVRCSPPPISEVTIQVQQPTAEFTITASENPATPNSTIWLETEKSCALNWYIVSANAESSVLYPLIFNSSLLYVSTSQTEPITVRAECPDDDSAAEITIYIEAPPLAPLVIIASQTTAYPNDTVNLQLEGDCNVIWTISNQQSMNTALDIGQGTYTNLYIALDETHPIIVHAECPEDGRQGEIVIEVEQRPAYPNQIEVFVEDQGAIRGAQTQLWAESDQGDLSALHWLLTGSYDDASYLAYQTGEHNTLYVGNNELASQLLLQWWLETPTNTISGSVDIEILEPTQELAQPVVQARQANLPNHNLWQAKPLGGSKAMPVIKSAPQAKPQSNCGCAKPRANNLNPHMFISDGGSVYYYNK